MALKQPTSVRFGRVMDVLLSGGWRRSTYESPLINLRCPHTILVWIDESYERSMFSGKICACDGRVYPLLTVAHLLDGGKIDRVAHRMGGCRQCYYCPYEVKIGSEFCVMHHQQVDETRCLILRLTLIGTVLLQLPRELRDVILSMSLASCY